MKAGNISVFIPHAGCPHACSFCSQKTISDTEKAPSAEEVGNILRKAYDYYTDSEKRHNTEIAFFGGSFTAIDRDYMISLLEAAYKFISDEGFFGIRISTRPDYIDEEILSVLKKYKVTAVELGAQSMNDEILSMNRRGHSAEDVVKASALIKAFGFELGLQVMTGLYGSSPEEDLKSFKKIAEIHPDTVRIYPTAVLDGTYLGELYKSGKYVCYPFSECVRICADGEILFHNEHIRIIRMGLHAETSIEKKLLGGFYHPAFAEIVRSELFARKFSEVFSGEEQLIEVSPKDKSVSIGHKKSNLIRFKNLKITENSAIERDNFLYKSNLYNIYREV